jgi:acyl carrier protein
MFCFFWNITKYEMYENGDALFLHSISQDGRPSGSPFQFATVKGRTGHQESAAGAVGLMEAAQLVQHAAVPAALHVRHLNPRTHGALRGHAVGIARGGLQGLSLARTEAPLAVGVSSFGAQGTNAHAIVAGNGAPHALETRPLASDPCWRRIRFWVAPPLQSVLTHAWVRRSAARGRGATSALFHASLASPGLASLWQYSVQGRSHLSGSAALAMAAAAVPLLHGDAAAGSGLAATLVDISAVSPKPLGPLRRNGTASAPQHLASISVSMASGSVELSFLQQKVLVGKVGTAAEQAVSALKTGRVSSPEIALCLLEMAVFVSETPYPPTCVAEATPLGTAEAAGCALHHLELESLLQQVAVAAPAAHGLSVGTGARTLTWVRNVGALVLPAADATLHCGRGIELSRLAASATMLEGWAVGSASSACNGGRLAAQIFSAVMGDHDLPPSSPSPYTPVSPHRGAQQAQQAAQLAFEEERDELHGHASNNPLLTMSEEERALHLQAQVASEVRAMMGHAIHPDEPLIAAGLDSRGGMELRRSLAVALGMQLPVTLLYDYQSINAVVDYISEEVEKQAVKAGAPLAHNGLSQSLGDEGELTDDEGADAVARRRTSRALAAVIPGAASAAAGRDESRPSQLLKTLRPPAVNRPLFLAAPGVANAQSAYFSFSMFLQASFFLPLLLFFFFFFL